MRDGFPLYVKDHLQFTLFYFIFWRSEKNHPLFFFFFKSLYWQDRNIKIQFQLDGDIVVRIEKGW